MMEQHVNWRADFERFWYEFSMETKHFIADLKVWLSDLSPGEAAIGLCGFTLVLLFIMIRRPSGYKEGGGMGRQFVLALALVMIFGFGAGYLLDGSEFIRHNLF